MVLADHIPVFDTSPEHAEYRDILHTSLHRLTSRQREVLGYLALGYSNTEVGELTGTSESNIYAHKRKIKEIIAA